MATKSGSVKWFDGNKGFGFISDDEGGSDILLHANVLRNYGHSSVVEGTRIKVEIIQSQRGLQATEVLSLDIPEIDPETILRGVADLGIDFDALDKSQPLTPARVKWFDKGKGFGFVNIFQGTDDVFVHMEVLRAYGMSELVQGEALCVRTTDGPRGQMAVEVRAWDFAAKPE